MAFEYLATGRGERLFGDPVAAIAEDVGEYPQLTSQQKLLLECFDTLNPRQRSGLLDLLNTGAPRPPSRARRRKV
jgi:hypothetical protein